MDSNEVYKKLIYDYNNLSDEAKRAILIYKSALFYHINELSTIDNFLEIDAPILLNSVKDKDKFILRYNDFKKIISNTNNSLIKYVVFKDVDFTDIYTFIESIKKIYSILNNTRLYLHDNITVYRGVNYEKELCDVSKSNIISTSIDPEQTSPFLFSNEKNNKRLYAISLEKNTPVIVCPYSIKNIYDSEIDYLTNQTPKQLKIVNDLEKGQQEIILFKNSLQFIQTDIKKVDKYNLTIEKLNTKLKFKEIKNKSK